MNTLGMNVCVRCGAERIVLKSWSEKIGSQTVIVTQTVCPNPECQKKVEADNKKQSDKRLALRTESEQRILNKSKLRYSNGQKDK